MQFFNESVSQILSRQCAGFAFLGEKFCFHCTEYCDVSGDDNISLVGKCDITQYHITF